jgi:hypothetical protein
MRVSVWLCVCVYGVCLFVACVVCVCASVCVRMLSAIELFLKEAYYSKE